MARRFSNLTAMKPFRRSLRAALTPAEACLWTALRGSQLAGRKFRRQHSFGSYVIDFYCPQEKLAVELDGAAHDSAAAEAKDEARDAFLGALGIRVLRYENRDVVDNLEGVLLDIGSRFAK
jgi:very-short-patch-repair endonuclease